MNHLLNRWLNSDESYCCWRWALMNVGWLRRLRRALDVLLYRISNLFDNLRLREHLKAHAEWEARHGKPYPWNGAPDIRLSKLWVFCVRWHHWWMILEHRLLNVGRCDCEE